MADPHPGEPPKIFVDTDWKAQAQKEREKLAEKERAAKEAEKAKPAASPVPGMPGAQAGAAAAGAGGAPAIPPADFHTLVGTMVTQALMYMGAFPDPETGRAIVSLEHARFHIDLLAVLQEKTKGNLGKDEESDLSQAVNELRLRYVDIVKAIAQMKQEGKLRPAGGAAGGPGELGTFSGQGMGGMGGMTGPGLG